MSLSLLKVNTDFSTENRLSESATKSVVIGKFLIRQNWSIHSSE